MGDGILLTARGKWLSLVVEVKRNNQRVMCRFTWGHVGRWW
jgi:hypothetical protein